MMMAATCSRTAVALLRRAQRPLLLQAACFSSAAAPQQTRIQLPPNLKIDPKSKSSPFFVHVDKDLDPEEDGDDDDDDDDDDEVDNDIISSDEQELDDDFYEEEVDDNVWFEPPTPLYAIPLPERLHVDVIDKSNLSTTIGDFYLSPILFGQEPIRTDLVQRVVQYQRNKKRGKRNAITKTISEVSGSGKKVRPQKGGGTSRAGHRRPAHWRGGAKAHGPKGKIQDYTSKLNKHTRQLGLLHALSQKLKEGNLMVVNDFMVDSHKTKDLATVLTNIGLSGDEGESAFLIDWADNDDPKVFRNLPLHLAVASGNLQRIKVSTQDYINVYDIVKHEKLILTLSAITALEARLGKVAY
jgi:large subunit ribosomal protein L4